MITFTKLERLLKDRGLNWSDLTKASLSKNMYLKFKKNQIIQTDSIDKICAWLNVQPGDIMSYVSNEQELEDQIVNEINKLQTKLKQIQKNK